jgi:hypothetical protein
MVDPLHEAYKLIDLQTKSISILKEHVKILKERIADQEEIIELLKKNLELEMQLRVEEKKLALIPIISLN